MSLKIRPFIIIIITIKHSIGCYVTPSEISELIHLPV